MAATPSQLQLVQLLPGFWLWLAAPALIIAIASGVAYTQRSGRLGLTQTDFRRWSNRASAK